jgi:hypothetical protein
VTTGATVNPDKSRQISRPLAHPSTDAGAEDPFAGQSRDVRKSVALSSVTQDLVTEGLAGGVNRRHHEGGHVGGLRLRC